MASGMGRVLAIAGSDSGGGAGVQADIKTITALGGYAASAITAVTVQDTLGVHAVHPIPPAVIAAQIRAVLADIGADAIKTGMLGDAAAVEAVLAALADWPDIPLVVDPVMVATSGASLLGPDAMASAAAADRRRRAGDAQRARSRGADRRHRRHDRRPAPRRRGAADSRVSGRC